MIKIDMSLIFLFATSCILSIITINPDFELKFNQLTNKFGGRK
jgi:hypothetical protein